MPALRIREDDATDTSGPQAKRPKQHASELVVGSLVWARLPDSIWWPAIIDQVSPNSAYYRVVYFEDSCCLLGWMNRQELHDFTGVEDNIDGEVCALGVDLSEHLQRSVWAAREALATSHEQRVARAGFRARASLPHPLSPQWGPGGLAGFVDVAAPDHQGLDRGQRARLAAVFASLAAELYGIEPPAATAAPAMPATASTAAAAAAVVAAATAEPAETAAPAELAASDAAAPAAAAPTANVDATPAPAAATAAPAELAEPSASAAAAPAAGLAVPSAPADDEDAEESDGETLPSESNSELASDSGDDETISFYDEDGDSGLEAFDNAHDPMLPMQPFVDRDASSDAALVPFSQEQTCPREGSSQFDAVVPRGDLFDELFDVVSECDTLLLSADELDVDGDLEE